MFFSKAPANTRTQRFADIVAGNLGVMVEGQDILIAMGHGQGGYVELGRAYLEWDEIVNWSTHCTRLETRLAQAFPPACGFVEYLLGEAS